MADADGIILEAPDDTGLDVHVDAITEEMYVEHSARRWACVAIAKREDRGATGVQDRRDLQRLLGQMESSGAVREG